MVLIIGWDNAKNAWLCKNSWGAVGGPESDGTFWMNMYDDTALDFYIQGCDLKSEVLMEHPISSGTSGALLRLGFGRPTRVVL